MSRKKYKDYTIEEIKAELAEFDKTYDRQHGRTGVELDDPEAEKRRLWNNLVSRRSRKARKEAHQRHDKAVREALHLHDGEDEWGIAPVDERRYRSKFKSGYIGAPVKVEYIRRMTGLKLFQMYQLQERTGLIPTPRITKEQADADYQRCIRTGDIY
jgi:hypothetical protein